MLLTSLRLQRDQIIQSLATAGFSIAGSDRRLYSGVEQGVRQVLHHLAHLQKVWQPVLPPNVYNRYRTVPFGRYHSGRLVPVPTVSYGYGNLPSDPFPDTD